MTGKPEKSLLTNCIVWTGTVGSATSADVLIEGRHIAAIGPAIDPDRARDAVVVDAGGATIIPGLVDGHSHLSFLETKSIVDFGYMPPEEHLLATMDNARRVLLAGFTSCVGASSAKARLDIAIRNAINAGQIPGPRLLASTPELTVSGGLGDERLLHIYRESEAVVLDGAEEIRKYVRVMCREGCDVIKLTISGSPTLPNAPASSTVMTEEEIAAACSTAKRFGKRLASHSHSSESVQLSIKHGIELIHHCTLIDERTMDLVEENKDLIFLGPAMGAMHNTMFEATEFGITDEGLERSGFRFNFESAIRVYTAIRERDAARLVIGGDYGFAWTPHGTQARDLEHFVNYFGFSPEEALVCGTVVGAQAMKMEHQIGRIKAGFLADLVIVDGRPHIDVSCVSKPENILMVMKDGQAYGMHAIDHARAKPGDTVQLLPEERRAPMRISA